MLSADDRRAIRDELKVALAEVLPNLLNIHPVDAARKLTRGDVARVLNIHLATVDRFIAMGRLPYETVGSGQKQFKRFTYSDVMKLAADRADKAAK